MTQYVLASMRRSDEYKGPISSSVLFLSTCRCHHIQLLTNTSGFVVYMTKIYYDKRFWFVRNGNVQLFARSWYSHPISQRDEISKKNIVLPHIMFIGTCQKVILAHSECSFFRHSAVIYKQLSYRRETALQGRSVVAKNGRWYSADTIGLSSTTLT